ncbi:MAG: hypothetical protein JO345_20350 [Streptosporangiaceae bacterium]|nr:hypothetical protein [Streptosporangiaceae bacterium]
MRVGYSFWGFLGAGITDTPDGGRSHRRTLIDGINSLGHQIVFLQPNRDLTQAGEDLRGTYTWELRLPTIDVLFLEWRWPIPGRNTTSCGSPGHTCDLHRQAELLEHYTRDRRTPTLLWDKDLQLPADHPLRGAAHVTVCEAALHPGPGATQLLFPVADTALECADPVALAALPRDLPLVYVGNQYDRDEPFDCYFAPVAATVGHLVAGKWTDTRRWPHVQFTGRVPFAEVEQLHRRALATMLLAPDRLAVRGQFTQRIFEAALAGCVPITSAYLRAVEQVVPPELIARDAEQARAVLHSLAGIAGGPQHAELIGRCLHHLDPFRLSRQLRVLARLLDQAISSRGIIR